MSSRRVSWMMDRERAERVEEGLDVGSRYQLLGCIGRGGMGAVFEAWDRQLERRVALKLLFASRDAGHAMREARYLARVSHPNVVCVHDVGRCEREARGFAPVYIAMELVEGADLNTWLRAGTRRWTEVLEHLLATGRGVAAIHRAGLVHGDIKPGNVLIGRDRVRVADFGLAHVSARAVSAATLASVREAAAAVEAELGLTPGAGGQRRALDFEIELRERGGGTVPYMAPECLAGERLADSRADQYGLCAMAWEALYGVRPFGGANPTATLAAIARQELARGRRPWGMPRAIEGVLRRGLSDDPGRRWSSVEALIDALLRARARPRRALELASVIAASSAIALGVDARRGAEHPERVEQALELTATCQTAQLERADALDDAMRSVGRALTQLDAEGSAAQHSAPYGELLRARAQLDRLVLEHGATGCPAAGVEAGDQSLASR